MKRAEAVAFTAAIAVVVLAGGLTAVALGGPATQQGSPGDAPQDLMSQFSKPGDCVQAIDYTVAPPNTADVSRVSVPGWLSVDGAFVGTLEQATEAFKGSNLRSGPDWAWMQTGTRLIGLARFEAGAQSVWVLVSSIELASCPPAGPS